MANANRYYKTPFAESGNKSEVPNVSVGGAVGFDSGFGPDYELPQGSPSRKRIERDLYNGMHFGITKNLKQWQESLYPTWIEDDGTGVAFAYPQGMIVNHAGQDWISNEDANQEEPGAGAKWSIHLLAKFETYGNVATLAAGKHPVGSYVSVTDRASGVFLVQSGGVVNGFDVLDAGNGNTASLQDAASSPASHFGLTSSTPDITAGLDRMQDVKGKGFITLDAEIYTGKLLSSTLYSISMEGKGELATSLVTPLSSDSGFKVPVTKQFRSAMIKGVSFYQEGYQTQTQGTGTGLDLSDAATSVNYHIQDTSFNYFDIGVDSSANAFSNQFDTVRCNFCNQSFNFSGGGQLINHTFNNLYSSQPTTLGMFIAGCKNFVFNTYNSGSAGGPHLNIAGGSTGIIFNSPNFEQDVGTLGGNTEAIRVQSDSEVIFNYPTFASPKAVDSTTYLLRVINDAVVYVNSPKIVGADANIQHILIQDNATVYLDDPKGAIDRSKVTVLGNGRLIDVNAGNVNSFKASGKIASHPAGSNILTGLSTVPSDWSVEIDPVQAGVDTLIDIQPQVTEVGTGTLKVRFIVMSTGAQSFGSWPIKWSAR